LRQTVLVYKRFRPDIIEQFFAGDQISRVLDQIDEHIERVGVDRDDRLAPPQTAGADVQLEFSELKDPS
jgi:hypothetical protein